MRWNIRRLIVARAVELLTPRGGRLADLHTGLLVPSRISSAAREAAEWVKGEFAAAKATPGNHRGDDDEAIAGEILRRLQQRARGA